MKISKIRIKNFKSIKDSGEILINEDLFVLAGQNESGKSSILEALICFEKDEKKRDNLNFELANNENYVQEISCTFQILNEDKKNDIVHELFNLAKNKLAFDIKDVNNFISDDFKKKISEFTLTRVIDFTSENEVSDLNLDKSTIGKLRGSIKKYESETNEQDENKNEVTFPYLEIDSNLSEIANCFFIYTPQIVLFNDFSILLPDKILLEQIDNENTEGYQAVKNLESLLQKEFKIIAAKESRQRKSATEEQSKLVSANFQDDWQQKIFGNNSVNITFDIKHNENGKQEIEFSIQTKDNEFLAPKRRSKGMIWFLSLWLELKARENQDTILLLFDEPGLHLHIKANKDMLKVFHKLNIKGHQIIYSTHSPALIDVDRLQNIGLVVNNKENGTSVEGLTSSNFNSSNKKDALQPISEAMGLQPLRDFPIFKEKNVLVEGLSDFWILKGMGLLLGRLNNYAFVPAVGIKGNKIYPLISLCMGYGLDWLLVMDGGEHPKQQRELLKANLFNNDENLTNKKIYLSNVDEIENIFDLKVLSKIDSSLTFDPAKSAIEIIGKNRKIIFSKLFYEKVHKGSLKKSYFKTSTLREFEKIFDWIELQFDF